MLGQQGFLPRGLVTVLGKGGQVTHAWLWPAGTQGAFGNMCTHILHAALGRTRTEETEYKGMQGGRGACPCPLGSAPAPAHRPRVELTLPRWCIQLRAGLSFFLTLSVSLSLCLSLSPSLFLCLYVLFSLSVSFCLSIYLYPSVCLSFS